jgi:hypothetical protein
MVSKITNSKFSFVMNFNESDTKLTNFEEYVEC